MCHINVRIYFCVITSYLSDECGNATVTIHMSGNVRCGVGQVLRATSHVPTAAVSVGSRRCHDSQT